MVRLLHTSDFQLGRSFHGIGRCGDILRNTLKRSFEERIAYALEAGVDLFLVAGNLFADNLVSRHLIDFVLGQVERLGRIPFVVVPGARDRFQENSILFHLSEGESPDNFYLMSSDRPLLRLPHSEVVIEVGNTQRHETLPAGGSDESGVRILVVTQDASRTTPEGRQLTDEVSRLLNTRKFHYAAIGGIDEYTRWSDRVCSSGAPEMLRFDATESGAFLIVEIDKPVVTVERIPSATLRWKELTFDSKRFRYNLELEQEIRTLASSDLLLRVVLTGERAVESFLDLWQLERSLCDQFCFLEIVDESRPAELRQTEFESSGLVGEFTSLMRESLDKVPEALQRKYIDALSMGRALLSGRDLI